MDNIKPIMECPVTNSIKQLRSFNGLVNFYKKFMRDSDILTKQNHQAAERAHPTRDNLDRTPLLVVPQCCGGSFL